MAFVILSAGTLAQSKMHTLSIRTFLGIAAATLIVVLASGFALGYAMNRSSADGASPGIPGFDEPQGRLLIDRFGELSGRLLQLEAEAVELAARIGMIKDFESRIGFDGVSGKRDRVSKTPPAAPSGGPMLRPIMDTPAVTQDAAAAGSRSELDAGPWSKELERFERDIGRVAGSLARLDRLAASYSLAFMSFPARPPVAEVAPGSSFGNRIDPFNGRLAFHSGVDYAAPKGTPILASAGGEVVFSGYRPFYGNTVEIDHGGGLVTRYAHASKLLVKVGQVVMPGQEIAKVGSTGRSTGPHLHFEILKDGYTTDPARYIAGI